MADVDPLEGNNPDAEGVDTRPEWLPENFKSPEDLVKSYNEAQTKIRDQGTQLNALTENYAAVNERFDELVAAQTRPDPNAVYAQWQEAFEADPIGTVTQIAQATAAQVHQQYAQQNQSPQVTPDVVAYIADQQMNSEHEDWGQYKTQVSELVAQNPLFNRDDLWVSPQSATQALESAYQMVKAQDVLSGSNVVQQQVADTRAMKLGAQSAAGASGRSPSPDEYAQRWEEIMNAPSTKLGL